MESGEEEIRGHREDVEKYWEEAVQLKFECKYATHPAQMGADGRECKYASHPRATFNRANYWEILRNRA